MLETLQVWCPDWINCWWMYRIALWDTHRDEVIDLSNLDMATGEPVLSQQSVK